MPQYFVNRQLLKISPQVGFVHQLSNVELLSSELGFPQVVCVQANVWGV